MADNGVMFGAEYSNIKTSTVHMNERKESGHINQGECGESLCREWIPMVRTFTDSWRKNMVINDLRVAEALEIPGTMWPPFTLIPLADITPVNP